MKNNFYSILCTVRNFIDDSSHEVEKRLFESIVKKLGFKYNNYNLENFKSEDFNSKILSYDYNIIPKALQIYYQENHIFENRSSITKPKFNTNSDNLIIGIQTEQNEPLLSQTLQLLAEHVYKILLNDTAKVSFRIILILPALPLAGTDLLEKMLKPYCITGQLVISDWNGKTVHRKSFEKEFQIYMQESNLLAPKIKIEQKMIRKVGHFRRPTKSQSSQYKCHRYFYEGNECVKELKEFIRNTVKQFEYESIMFFCPESKWLKESIEFAKNDLEIYDKIVIDTIDFEKKLDINKLKNNFKKCLFLFDLIDTGESYRNCIAVINKSNSGLVYEVMTVLITENESNTNLRSQIKDFILEVKQKSYDNPQICPLCKLGLEHDSKNEETYHLLSSFNFWALAEEAKFENENEFPSYIREPMKSVPIFSSMLTRNKAYLAYKTQLLLSQKGFKQLKNYIYISPDETGAKAYAKSLNSLYGIYTIVIPRADLEKLNSIETIDLNFLNTNFKDKNWYKEIERRDDDYIIFDEFTVSGATFKDITKLLHILYKTVVAYLPLIKFTEKDNINEIPLLSLYSFDIFISKPKLKPNLK